MASTRGGAADATRAVEKLEKTLLRLGRRIERQSQLTAALSVIFLAFAAIELTATMQSIEAVQGEWVTVEIVLTASVLLFFAFLAAIAFGRPGLARRKRARRPATKPPR